MKRKQIIKVSLSVLCILSMLILSGCYFGGDFSINPPAQTIKVGQTVNLVIISKNKKTANSATWNSSDTSVATVDTAGTVKGVADGEATITAMTPNGKSASCTITVKSIEIEKIVLSQDSAVIKVKKTLQLEASLTPENASDAELEWNSDDTSVATVNSSGLVTAKSVGTATITCVADSGKKATCTVTVKDEYDGGDEDFTNGGGQTMWVGNCAESITLRKKPSTSAGEYTQIPFGAPVTFISKSSNGFYKVRYNGRAGYALASYLLNYKPSESERLKTTSPSPKYQTTMTVVNCNEYITLRTSPSTSAAEITKIPLYSTVTFVSNSKNGFYKVIYNGHTGYALAQYLD